MSGCELSGIPKVFVGLVEHGGGLTLITPHCVTQYTSHPIDPSPWDGQTFAFVGDILTGNHISIVAFPNNAYNVILVNIVAMVAGMQALLAADPTITQVRPLINSKLDTEALGARCMMSIPPVYVLDHTLSPRTLWEQLGVAIMNNGCKNKGQELMNWIRYALTA